MNIFGRKKVEGKPLPSLGDSRKRYAVELTEPEINAIFSAVAFVGRFTRGSIDRRIREYWDHYGSTLEALSSRLEVFDDGDAPFSGTANGSDGAQEHPAGGTKA